MLSDSEALRQYWRTIKAIYKAVNMLNILFQLCKGQPSRVAVI